MNPELHFLGWDTPATVKVREFLLPHDLSPTVDLGESIIVVPTQQSGRRLKEALARQCSSRKAALFSLRIVTPPYFLHPEDASGTIAHSLEMAATWAEIMMNIDPGLYKGLFPSHVPSQDFLWSLHTGEMIERLRDRLADGGYSITNVYNGFKDILEELERWHDLAELESAYLKRLSEKGRIDPCREMLRQVETPQSPKGVKRIVVAGVPDPTPLMIRKLEHLSGQNIPIDILIHAPKYLADCFDGWGRPSPAKWHDRLIDVPDPHENVILCGSPQLQSRKVTEIIAREQVHFGPADIAIGVPDSEVIPFLETDLTGSGLAPLNPAGKPADQHSLFLLLRNFRDLVSEGDYAAVAAFLRNSDFLDYLVYKQHVHPDKLLEELDRYQNEHLPGSLRNMARQLNESTTIGVEFPSLTKAMDFLEEQVRNFNRVGAVSSLRLFLQTIYEFRVIDSGKAEDNDFAAMAELIDEALYQMSESPLAEINLDSKKALEILIWYLRGKKYFPEPVEEAVIDLEGWMELPWNDAPLLIVTGMNDGLVPDGRPDDIFLPDTLRRQLNLPDDENRLAVYTYQMTFLIESRREQGRALFITGKTGGGGDALKPSRLLLQCDDSELPGRARKLFGTTPESLERYSSDISFQLEAAPPPDVPAYRLELKRIPVTAFREYLNCPFRFYLKRVLDMEAIDDLKTELDAMDFGSLVHDVLYEMARNGEMRQCENVTRLQNFLNARTEDWIKARLGPLPPLQVEAQMESARQRLRQAAEIQVCLVMEGWEIISWERPIQDYIDGVLVRGKIDRIDRHRNTGRIRVLDYKTSEGVSSPEEAHFGPLSKDVEYQDYIKVEINERQRRWADLQLPLYAILLSSKEEPGKPYELGYFNLPKSVNDTGVVLWEDFSPALLESAEKCARGIISDIRKRRFWPPSTKLLYDDFENLFPSEPALCINIESFELFMNRGRML